MSSRGRTAQRKSRDRDATDSRLTGALSIWRAVNRPRRRLPGALAARPAGARHAAATPRDDARRLSRAPRRTRSLLWAACPGRSAHLICCPPSAPSSASGRRASAAQPALVACAAATRPVRRSRQAQAVTAGRAGGAPRPRDRRAGGWCRDRTGASAPRCDSVRWRTRSADGTRSQTAAPAARAARP